MLAATGLEGARPERRDCMPTGRRYRRGERAGVAELADALDLGSSDENRGGSNPPARTIGAAILSRARRGDAQAERHRAEQGLSDASPN